MNRERRAALQALVERIEDIRAELEGLRDEEQDYIDNMPDSLRGGDPGAAIEQRIEALTEAYEALETTISAIGEATGP